MRSFPRIAVSILAVAFATAILPSAHAQRGKADIPIANFDGPDYGDWKTTGTAFGTAPATGSLPGQMAVSGYRGHGFVDSFLGGDDATGTLTSPEFKIDRPYINFLIGGGGFSGKTCIDLRIDGKVVRTATGPNLNPGGSERLSWHSWDVKSLKGKTATIQIVDAATGGWGHINVDDISQGENRKAIDIVTDVLYGETYRPQFHFTAKVGWLNDPNGLCFLDGEYHLFFQANPHGLFSNGVMYWGQAISTDLVHWKEIGYPLVPDNLGTMFSGSAIVDVDNTSGFGKPGEKPFVAIYTAAGGINAESKGKPFSQCITYSLDKGRTWTKFAGNPVVPHIVHENRDPKVVWFAPTKRWIMALYLDGENYGFFSSPDLKTWTQTQTITVHGCSECPDFFEMPLDGDEKNRKWVFTGANGHYRVGSFDGTTFTPETEAIPDDFGANFYAVQTFSDIPASDGRRIQIAWMNGGVYPQMPFNQQMSFPCELKLVSTPDGMRLNRWPVQEISSLYEKPDRAKNAMVSAGEANAFVRTIGERGDISLDIDLKDAKSVTLQIRGETLRYDVVEQTITCLGRRGKLKPVNNRISLRLLFDTASLELYGNGGQLSMTSCFLPDWQAKELRVFAEGGAVEIVSYERHGVKSSWAGGRGRGGR